jgi:DNA-binding response OmpR family regulator
MQVLLVDDDPVIVRLLEVNFRIAGFTVRSASRGDQALALATAEPPDAVVMDVMMPGLDGVEVVRRMREHPALADVPVVLLTARGDAAVDAAPGRRGPVDVVAKPFDPAHVVAVVRSRLEGSA